MKKIVALLMMLFTISTFADKVTTNGKDNLNKMRGKWIGGEYVIKKIRTKWYFSFINGETGKREIYELKKYKPGVFIAENYDLILAWDTKLNTMVTVDKELEIQTKWTRGFIQN